MSGEPTATQIPGPQPAVPSTIKRARVLLVIFSVALALWTAGLLGMYFTTVYPQRHPASGSKSTATR